MTAAQRRVKSLVDRYGESFTVGATTGTGVFTNVTTGNAHAFLTTSEIDAAALPLWVCLVAHDDATAVGDTVSWNSRSLTVKKVAEARFLTALTAKMLIMD